MAQLPKFRDELEESDFWDTHDSTDYMDDTGKVDVKFVDARPKTLISLRLQSDTIEQLKALAAKRGIGYQTMIRMWVMERLQEETASIEYFKTLYSLSFQEPGKTVSYTQRIQGLMRNTVEVGATMLERMATSRSLATSSIEQTLKSWQQATQSANSSGNH